MPEQDHATSNIILIDKHPGKALVSNKVDFESTSGPSVRIGATAIVSSRPLGLGSTVQTLFVRNIPARFTAKYLLREWPSEGSYNLLYTPYSHKLKRIVGCAVVNFISPQAAEAFYNRWHNHNLAPDTTVENLSVEVADTQGWMENLQNLRFSKKVTKMKNSKYLPVVIEEDGTVANYREFMNRMWPDDPLKYSEENASGSDSS
jgi:hypothetical protein